MKLSYAIMLTFVLLVSACAQQTQPTVNPIPDNEVQEPQEQAEEQPAEEQPAPVLANEARIAGKSIDPLEISIDAGDSVTWFNSLGKGTTLTIMKDGKHYMNSPLIKEGEKWEHEFTEPGEYEYWTLAFGPQGAKVIVS